MSLSRVPEALGLPLYWTGLTADRMLAYIALIRIGALTPWIGLELSQTRASNAPDRIALRFEQAFGSSAVEKFRALQFFRRVRRDAGTGRFDGAREFERFGAALSGVAPTHPVLRALGATVGGFVRAGVPVYVYVNPANVDNLERVGVMSPTSLAVSVAGSHALCDGRSRGPADLQTVVHGGRP